MRKRIRLTDENDPLTQTEQVLAGFEQVSKLASQQVNKSTSQNPEIPASQKTREDLDAQQVNLLKSQLVEKSTFKKATFQIDSQILQQLDSLHLRFQVENGKSEAPYKEVIVEEAIAQFLEQINKNEAKILKNLKIRQKSRES